MTLDRASGLFFLAFCIAYGVLAANIELYFGEEGEAFTARTFPTALAWAGGAIAFLIVVLPSKEAERPELAKLRALDWRKVALLCGLMVFYGLTIKTIGFLVSTSLFLIAGYMILGERRWYVIAGASLPVVAGFQFALHGIMGIYLVDPLLKALGIIS
ncbi:MAG: tripartite tricarboxylate transporter TctB family protein [Alphaproteobacteria bacterium]